MYATSVVLLLCSVAALSTACCTPDQWEGEEGIIGGYASRKHHGLLKEFVGVAYDASNNRTAAYVDYHNGEHSKRFKIVTRYDDGEGKLYVYDVEKDKCWTKKLEQPFRRACIPHEAKSVGSYYLGLKDGFKVTGYELKGKRVNAFVSVQETADNQCIPVSEAIYGSLNKVGFIQTVGFINVTPGIKNETVFDIPKKCDKTEDFPLSDEYARDYFTMAI